jgi:hypothetical protein
MSRQRSTAGPARPCPPAKPARMVMTRAKPATAQDEQDICKLRQIFATGFLKKDGKVMARTLDRGGNHNSARWRAFPHKAGMEKHCETVAVLVTNRELDCVL